MKSVIVYSVDRKTNQKLELGVVTERRKEERGCNIIGLIRYAMNTFEPVPSGGIQYVVH